MIATIVFTVGVVVGIIWCRYSDVCAYRRLRVSTPGHTLQTQHPPVISFHPELRGVPVDHTLRTQCQHVLRDNPCRDVYLPRGQSHFTGVVVPDRLPEVIE